MTNEEKLKNTFDYILSRYFIMLLLFYAESMCIYQNDNMITITFPKYVMDKIGQSTVQYFDPWSN